MQKLNPKKIEIPAKGTYKLDTMRYAAGVTNHPELGRKTIIVAGTNGKGSTCTYLTHLFLEAKLSVGTYLSPHLIGRTERIRINGKPISEIELKLYEKKYESILEPLSYFERLTLLAFLIFRDKKVDLQVLEVGIGGRLDATNICSPDFSVITRIDFDHQNVLGKTLREISFEKAGIMRAQKPVFIAHQNSLVLNYLKVYSKKIKAGLVRAEKYAFSKTEVSVLAHIQKQRGEHQKSNASTALAVFKEAQKIWNFKAKPESISRALKKDILPARIQILKSKPYFIVDGSHNPNSLDALTQFLKRKLPRIRFTVVFGSMDDKPTGEMLLKLSPFTDSFLFPSFYREREVAPEKILKLAETSGLNRSAKISRNLRSDINRLWSGRKNVLIVGSLYLAGRALSILEKTGKA